MAEKNMAKPRIFISSTFYDLKQIRSDLDNFIESLGYETIRNEDGEIPYGNNDALEEYCYKEIKNADILISIIGGRYGSKSSKNDYSISQMELKIALKENKQIYIFIEKNISSENELYALNKDVKGFTCKYAEDKKIHHFIDEIKDLKINNNIKTFEMASDITKYLKDQFAGLFQRFLENQTRIKEYELVKSIENTSKTLNNLVELFKEENKDKVNDVDRILMLNHPLISELKKILKIPYNFFIDNMDDLNKLLGARGYKRNELDDDDDFYFWGKNKGKKNYNLRINNTLFDETTEILKYIEFKDWDEKNVELLEMEESSFDDDFPF